MHATQHHTQPQFPLEREAHSWEDHRPHRFLNKKKRKRSVIFAPAAFQVKLAI
jgi:hypothetical protein